MLSGSLDWSPLHTSPQFWKDNVGALEERDSQILRVLLKLLEASKEVSALMMVARALMVGGVLTTLAIY